jgi:hypothetical protein
LATRTTNWDRLVFTSIHSATAHRLTQAVTTTAARLVVSEN